MYVDKSKKKLFEEKLREAHIDYHSYEVREHLNLLPQNVIFSNCHDSRPFSSSDEKNRSNICRQLKTCKFISSNDSINIQSTTYLSSYFQIISIFFSIASHANDRQRRTISFVGALFVKAVAPPHSRGNCNGAMFNVIQKSYRKYRPQLFSTKVPSVKQNMIFFTTIQKLKIVW